MEYCIPLNFDVNVFLRGFVWASHQQQTNERLTAQLKMHTKAHAGLHSPTEQTRVKTVRKPKHHKAERID